MANFNTGPLNGKWKGGRVLASNGYILVRAGKEFQHLADVRGYTYEHRVVAEKTIGRRLRPANPDWFREIREQCDHFGIAYFHKQNGGSRKIDGAWGGAELDGELYREFPGGPYAC